MGSIFYASSIPGENIPSLFVNQDIVFHVAVYLLLAYFFSRALKNTYQDITAAKLILFTVIFGVIYGITDELHQVFVPYRTVSAWDVFNDGMGSLIGSLLYR
jgi:VanZ family protein